MSKGRRIPISGRLRVILLLAVAANAGSVSADRPDVRALQAEPPVPMEVGPRDEVGKESLGRKAARGVIGGALSSVLGGRGRRGSASEGPRTRSDPTRRREFIELDQVERGITVGARSRWTDEGLLVSTRISDHDENGTYHAVYLESCDGRRLYPRRLEIYDLWAEHSLTVSWTRTTSVDGEIVSRESGGWSDSWTEHLGRHRSDESQPSGIWRLYGYERAHSGIQQLGAYFNLLPVELEQLGELALVTQVTRPAQDPVTTEPFYWLLSAGDGEPRLRDTTARTQESRNAQWREWQEACDRATRRETLLTRTEPGATVVDDEPGDSTSRPDEGKRQVRLEVLDAPKLYFQDQTADRLITFRLTGPEEMTVTALSAVWEPLVPTDDRIRANRNPQEQTCLSRPHEIVRQRPESTPVNTVTYFRLQETELDALAVEKCLDAVTWRFRPQAYPVAHGRWKLRAVVALADGIEAVESVDLCRSQEEVAWKPCRRRMLLVRDDAQVLEVGCDRDLDRVWQKRADYAIDGIRQSGGMGRHEMPKGGDEIHLKVKVTEHRVPLTGVEMTTLAHYGDPFYPPRSQPAFHNNPELQSDFHLAPAVDTSDLPRGGLKLRADSHWDWSGLSVKLDSYHDARFWENLAVDVFEDLWLTAATAGFGKAPIGVDFVLGSTSKYAVRFTGRKVTGDFAKLALEAGGQVADRQLQKLIDSTGVPVPVNAASLVAKLSEWAAGEQSFQEQSVAKAYGGYEIPEFLDANPPASGGRTFFFQMFSSSGQTVKVASYDDRDFKQALAGEVDFTAPTPDTPYSHLRFFLGGVVAIGSSSASSQVRIAEAAIRRVAPEYLAPVRFRFKDDALHEDCPAFDPGPRADLDSTFLEIAVDAVDAVDRPTEALPGEAQPPGGGHDEPPADVPEPAPEGAADVQADERDPRDTAGDGDAADEAGRTAGTGGEADPDRAPAFSFVSPAGNVTIVAGADAPTPFDAELRSLQGFEGPVTVKVGSLPGPGWGIEWEGSVDLAADETARVDGALIVNPDVERGSYRLTVVAEGDGMQSTHDLDVTVR